MALGEGANQKVFTNRQMYDFIKQQAGKITIQEVNPIVNGNKPSKIRWTLE